MLIALQMQSGMDGEMGVMRQQTFVLCGGLPFHYRRANDYIT